jgi:probable F420-dependent oxidoreductase
MPRLGLSIGTGEQPPANAVAFGPRAEQAGCTDFWSTESGGADGLSPLAALAAVTSKARLGTAILPVFTRPPALLAMSAATLHNLSRGRFVLGLGTSSSIIAEKWMGGSFERPLERLREYVMVLRDALAGNKVTFSGRTVRLEGFRLQVDPGAPIPIYLAALGPRACRLAGEIADGIILFLKTTGGVRDALGWMQEGARAAGRDPSELDCVMRIPVTLGDTDTEVLQRFVTGYAIVDVYGRSLAGQGFGSDIEAITSAWRSGDRRGATRHVSTRMLRDLVLMGGRDDIERGLQAFRDAGVKTPVLQFLSRQTGELPDLLAALSRPTSAARRSCGRRR